MRCSAFLGMSLDGCIAGPGGELGWLEAAGAPGEDHGFDAFVASCDVVTMGRGTWDVIAAVDPLPYRGLPVEVLTSRPLAPRAGVTAVSGTPADRVRAWEAAGHARAYVDGGQVVRDFMAAGLLDDLVLTFVPVLLGDGIRLFADAMPPSRWRLAGVRSWPSGLTQAAYARA